MSILGKIPEELLTILFIKFRRDVTDGILNLWNNDMLDCINTTISDFDDFIQNNKRSLE